MESYLVFYVVITILGVLFLWKRYLGLDRVRVLSPALLRARMEQMPRLIDVRSDRERELRAIEGSVHVPHDHIHEFPVNQDEFIVTYCSSGLRAHRAAEVLIKKGCKRVFAFDGDDRQLIEVIEDFKRVMSDVDEGNKTAV